MFSAENSYTTALLAAVIIAFVVVVVALLKAVGVLPLFG